MPSDNTTEAIDHLTVAVQGIDATFLLLLLIIIPVALTWAMFVSKSMMLGFPCLIFWSILSGDAYLLSSSTWDIYYFIFWGSIGMAIFCAFAAYGLRTRKEEQAIGDQFIDEGKEETPYVDEVRKPFKDEEDDERAVSRRRVQSMRDRIARRRQRWE